MKKFCALLLLTVLLLTVACSPKQSENDILSQKVTSKGKIPVTVLVKHAFTINKFEEIVEEKFPKIDLIQVGNYTSDMGIAEYEARMKHDDLTDIVMTWPVTAGEEYCAERLIDLSSMPFTSAYNTSRLNELSKNGKLYYLPGPSQVRGLVYNKTLMNEMGLTIPKNFEEFITFCHNVESKGVRALQLGLGNEEVLDTAFVGYGYKSSFSTPENARFLKDYNEGNGKFADNYSPALETFERLRDENIIRPSDLEVTYSDREFDIFNRNCLMVEDSVLMARMGNEKAGSTDEFALMPFFNPGEKDVDYARLYPVCFIGLNKHLTEQQNVKKYDIVKELMNYISTVDGQKALMADNEAMFSSLKGMEPPDINEIDDMLPALKHGRYGIFPTLKNAQAALRVGLTGLLKGEMTKEQVYAAVDAQNIKPPQNMAEIVIGSASKSFTLLETGNFITDTMRSYAGTDFALFLDNGKDGKGNGKGVSGKFYRGDLSESDIKRIMPDIRSGEKCEVWKVEMTGSELIRTLEYAIPVDNEQKGWFYYFSGLKIEFAPAAAPGKRIKKITDMNGKKLDLNKIYSVAVMDESVPRDAYGSCEKTGKLISDLIRSEISRLKVITPSNDKRFIIRKP